MRSRKIQPSLKANYISSDFSEIYEAPHPMPKRYSEGLPCFFVNPVESIESHWDDFWCYMESLGAEHDDVYMQALGESLGGNADFWLYTLASGSITGYYMLTDLLRKECGKSIEKSIDLNMIVLLRINLIKMIRITIMR